MTQGRRPIIGSRCGRLNWFSFSPFSSHLRFNWTFNRNTAGRHRRAYIKQLSITVADSCLLFSSLSSNVLIYLKLSFELVRALTALIGFSRWNFGSVNKTKTNFHSCTTVQNRNRAKPNQLRHPTNLHPFNFSSWCGSLACE